METTITPIVVYAEQTPNPAALKFVINKPLLEGGIQLEFPSVEFCKGAPLAQKLFEFPFVKNIFISNNYVSITKVDAIEWSDVMNELRDFLKTYFTNNGAVLNELPKITDNPNTLHDSIIKSTIVEEIDMRIVDVLNEYIKPAVEQDGGAITFRSFKDGVVTVALQGSCSGCPSSQMTLKAGIEGLLKRLIPEVITVQAEEL
jgi:NFU1 iron-sulfur cluster scaffold homolog, mitochondrial